MYVPSTGARPNEHLRRLGAALSTSEGALAMMNALISVVIAMVSSKLPGATAEDKAIPRQMPEDVQWRPSRGNTREPPPGRGNPPASAHVRAWREKTGSEEERADATHSNSVSASAPSPSWSQSGTQCDFDHGGARRRTAAACLCEKLVYTLSLTRERSRHAPTAVHSRSSPPISRGCYSRDGAPSPAPPCR